MNIEKTKILIIFIAIFICLNILIWFLLSIVEGTLFAYLWDRNTKELYLITVFSIIPTLIATIFITDKD